MIMAYGNEFYAESGWRCPYCGHPACDVCAFEARYEEEGEEI